MSISKFDLSAVNGSQLEFAESIDLILQIFNLRYLKLYEDCIKIHILCV